MARGASGRGGPCHPCNGSYSCLPLLPNFVFRCGKHLNTSLCTFEVPPPKKIVRSIEPRKHAEMSSTISLKLTNRAPKKPIKKLPATLDLPRNATVEDVKILIASKTGFDDHNRIGLFDPTTKKTLKNRKAQIGEESGVVSTGELVVKDLGTLAVCPLCSPRASAYR